MKKSISKTLRCAVYTRVSTDAGLEQEFNSLDAQREASEAYIKSQAHEGWRLIRTAYADGGFSGGSLQRPALQRLLEDVRARLVDVIVVYKVDRLTRSLADFAKLVELFDAQSVSFVSVTQSFNTTSSMGRLTLNVLLSFAQFEREVTGERIRDKIAASKKKGIWVGGVVPLGYRVEDRKLLIEPKEAATVRMMFERYLALGSMLPLLEKLNAEGITTRPRTLSSGRKIGGVPFTKGPLSHLLKNRTYLGEINHHGQSYPGEHRAIVDHATFEAVQTKLAENLTSHRSKYVASGALLIGKLFDDAGNTMTPTFARKGGIQYRYYTSRALVEGRRAGAGTINRVPAEQVETTVLEALKPLQQAAPDEDPRTFVRSVVTRIVIEERRLMIGLTDAAAESVGHATIRIPWTLKSRRPKREIVPNNVTEDERPIRSETRATLLRALAVGRQWLQELVSGKVSNTEAIAAREGRSKRSVHMMISLAFIAPDIVEAAVAGKLPRGIGISRLIDLPPSWAKQREMLGLTPSR